MKDNALPTALTLEGNIDRETFTRFALFDAFTRKKAWRNPLLFALILSAFAVVCLIGRKGREEAVLLASVLFGVGILLPVVWFGMFLSSVRRQSKASGLSRDRAQYYVTLLPDCVHVEKGKESARFPWRDIFMAYRARDCIYLYVNASRAFLLPACEKTDRAWEIITEHLPEEKRREKAR